MANNFKFQTLQAVGLLSSKGTDKKTSTDLTFKKTERKDLTFWPKNAGFYFYEFGAVNYGEQDGLTFESVDEILKCDQS